MQSLDRLHHDEEERRWRDERERDACEFAPAARPIQLGSLKQISRNIADRNQVEDHAPAGGFPDRNDQYANQCPVRVFQPAEALNAE
ncbi:hypothetical protein D3C86_1914870 [compost metagenome]